MTASPLSQVLKGRLLTFSDRPRSVDDTESYAYWAHGALAIQGGKIVWRGDAAKLPQVYQTWQVMDHRDHLILPGFIDTHTHFPQMGVIGSYGAQLLDWLETYTYKQEARFEDTLYCQTVANAFLDELINNGVTTAAVYATSHPGSAHALFEAAHARDMRMIAGKVLMDRGAPDAVCDTPQRAYDESKYLIDAWHNEGRLSYAITPRFAITSSPAQLELMQALAAENTGCYVQTHLSENQFEIDETLRLYPAAKDYTGVYEDYGLLGPRSLLGHCIHLSDRELGALKNSDSIAVFCPSSNLFLGSGLFDYSGMIEADIRVGFGTDVGAGTSYSMLATAADAYKICQLKGYSLNPFESYFGLTLGNARALSLEGKIGTLEVGTEADLCVLNSHATSAMRTRMESVNSLAEELFVLQTLGDDRSIAETYVGGRARKTSAI
ncbi:MAG: guanine deaminase [Henriciella sp.]|nr:guanine deaminase [Henriciella sp.]